MLFVLFLCSLGVAARLEYERRTSSEDAAECREGLAASQEELRRLRSCEGAETFLATFEACVKGVFTGAESQAVSLDNCSVSLGDEAIRFVKGSEEPERGEEEQVRGLAACLYTSQVQTPRSELDKIEGIYIDGHADPESGVLYNLDLASNRALTIYKAYFEQVTGRAPTPDDTDLDLDDTEWDLLSRVFPRAYGEMKPVAWDAASAERRRTGAPWPPDRRVTITIVMKLTPTGSGPSSASPEPGRPPDEQN